MWFYILTLVMVPLFAVCGFGEWVFQIVYNVVPHFRRWFDGLVSQIENP